MKLTFAQRRLLKRLVEMEGSAVSIEARDRGYTEPPSFRGRFHHSACPTCGSSETEPVSWLVIHALAEAGAIREAFRDSGFYNQVTDAGRAAITPPGAVGTPAAGSGTLARE